MSSSEWKDSDAYTTIDKVFCDGFEVFIGSTFMQNAGKSKISLLNKIQREVSELIVKNLLITSRNGRTYLWVTLNPETAYLTPRTMTHLR